MTTKKDKELEDLKALLTGEQDHVEHDEISIPMLRLAQPGKDITTPDSSAYVESIKAGHFYDTLNKESFGPSVLVSVLKFFGSNWIEFDPKNRSAIKDGCVPRGDPRTEGNEKQLPSGETEWVKPRATHFLDYALIFADDDMRARGPILWSASGRDIREARSMNGIVRSPLIVRATGLHVDKPVPFARIFRFSSKRHESNNGKVNYNLSIMPSGFQNDIEALKACHACLPEIGLLYSRDKRKLLPQQTRETQSESVNVETGEIQERRK